MDILETLVVVDSNSYNDILNTYDDIKEIYDNTSEDVISLFTTSLEDKVLIDTETLNYIITLLEKIYANNLALLFLMSCLSSLYVCTYTRRKKDYIMINNVEPKLLKGGVEKV
jgi:TnpA family transposase